MRARSLAARLALLQQSMALAVIVVFAGSSLWLTGHVLDRQRNSYLSSTADALARAYEDERSEQPVPALAAADMLGDAPPGIEVEIFDARHRLLARSHPPSSATRHAGAGSPTKDRGPIRRATARTSDGTLIVTTMTDALLRAGLAALGRSLLISALPLLALSLLLGRWIARRALRPLSAMADLAADLPIEQGVRSLGEPTGLEEIDRLKHSFDRLLERLDDALRAERQFTADASHELRTPLTVLSGELEMARALANSSAALAGSLAVASEQVRAMRELVEAILLLHRSGGARGVGEAQFEPVNLSDVAREVTAEAIQRQAGRRDDIGLEAPDEVLVPGQPALLGSAVRNLIDNALKFTQGGEPVRIVVGESSTFALVRVEDGGPGIPEHERDRVFDPFFRGAEARAGGAGFGLGLPILRRVARAHGGDVTVGASSLGGACFTLMLPKLEPES